MITAEEMRTLIDYDPETGVMKWRPRLNLKPKAGSWNERNAGRVINVIDSRGYLVVQIYKKKYRAHRLAWLIHYGKWPFLGLDHINQRPTDNRIVNLREATAAENGWNVNRTARNTSGVRGVTWHKGARKWAAGIHIHGRDIYLGLHVEFDDAVKARKNAELKGDVSLDQPRAGGMVR